MYMYVWSLCIAGPSRMMKKMIPNDMFYAHYPYRPDMEDSVILQILPAYCRFIFIHLGQCLRAAKIFLVLGDMISLVHVHVASSGQF